MAIPGTKNLNLDLSFLKQDVKTNTTKQEWSSIKKQSNNLNQNTKVFIKLQVIGGKNINLAGQTKK